MKYCFKKSEVRPQKSDLRSQTSEARTQKSGVRRWKFFILYSVFCILLITGCASAPKVVEEPAFFPGPPDPPRVQFLVSYAGAKDIEPEKSAFESFVTGEKESSKILDKPYGVAISEGKIYVCDTNATVMVFDLEKKTYGPLEGAKGLGKLIQPINISVDKNGYKYVTDPIRGQIVIFDRKDFYLKALGTPGNWKPVDAVALEDKVYVVDIKNSEIKVFNINTGEVVKTFGSTGEPEKMLSRPVNLSFDNEGYLYVSDAGRFQVVKFDRDGHFIRVFGKLGTNVGHFGRPRGVALDREGRLYAVDASFYNVQIFSKKGQNLLFFGGGGTKPGNLILPAKVVVDYDNLKYFEKYVQPNFEMEYLVIVTSQFGERLVNIFAFGKEKGKKYATDEELDQQLKDKILKEYAEHPEKIEEGEKAKEEPGKPREGEKGKEEAVKPQEGK